MLNLKVSNTKPVAVGEEYFDEDTGTVYSVVAIGYHLEHKTVWLQVVY